MVFGSLCNRLSFYALNSIIDHVVTGAIKPYNPEEKSGKTHPQSEISKFLQLMWP